VRGIMNETSTGYKKWLVWGVMVIAYMLVFFHRYSMGSMGDFIMKDFGTTAAVIGMIGAMYSWAYMLMQLPAGMLADSIGPRYTAATGMLVTFIGSLIFAYAPNVHMVMIGRFIIGIGVSVIFISTLRIQASWFSPTEFTRMSGLTVFMGKIGALIAETPLVVMIEKYGWRNTSVIIGVASLLLSILIFLFVRNTPHGDKYEHSDVSIWEGLISALKNKYTWFPMLVFFGIYASFMAFSAQWGNKFLQDVYHISKTAAANYVMASIIGHMLGAVTHGSMSDMLRSRKWYMAAVVGIYASLYPIMIWGMKAGWLTVGIALYVMFFLVGFTSAGLIISYTASKEVNMPRFSGIATSIVNMGGFLGSAIARPWFGKILDGYVLKVVDGVKVYSIDGYIKGFWFLFFLALIAFVGALLTYETGAQNRYEEIIARK